MNRGCCLCGALQFEAGPFDSMMHCHCSMCRKHHGAMFATFVTAPADGFRWLAGEDHVRTFRSSDRGLRPFCRDCGSVAPSVLPHMGTAFVPAGNLEGDPGRRPGYHMFAASRASWFPIAGPLPQHAAFPPGFGDSRPVQDARPALKSGVTGGSCLCGETAWEFTGPHERMWNCHCSRCRRARSAAHATNAFYRREQLEWTRGADNVASYALHGAKRFGQDFCRHCGSPVPRVVASTGYVVVPCGSLDTPLASGPSGNIFTGSKAAWFEIADGLPQWEASPA
jgi:hypothetical protein